jgi:hypothetical protein
MEELYSHSHVDVIARVYCINFVGGYEIGVIISVLVAKLVS